MPRIPASFPQDVASGPDIGESFPQLSASRPDIRAELPQYVVALPRIGGSFPQDVTRCAGYSGGLSPIWGKRAGYSGCLPPIGGEPAECWGKLPPIGAAVGHRCRPASPNLGEAGHLFQQAGRANFHFLRWAVTLADLMQPEPSPTRVALNEVVLNLNRIKTTERAREKLLNLIFTTTPADRAAVLIENTLWERERDDPEERVSERSGVVDEVLKLGNSYFSEDQSTICLPLDVNDNRLGVLYAETSQAEKRFHLGDFLLLQSTAKLGAEFLDRLIYTKRIEDQLARLQRDLGERYNLLGDSPVITELKAAIARVAKTNSTVLIQGESGTGKELVARAIHYTSSRAGKPFVAVNCPAFPENLLESELFGYEKGAFTGAIATKQGEFEAANGGTIFLDEVGDMALNVQPKLLRVLQERKMKRIGATRLIDLDVRIIAATNKDLPQAVAKKEFREDLYYRLNVVPIRTPPLRDRPQDIPVLASFFVANFAKDMGRMLPAIHADADALLRNYRWPGNVRELQNIIERAMVNLTGDVILPAHLPSELVEAGTTSGRYHDGVLACKRALIRNAWIQADGRAKEAAQILGLNPSSVHHLIESLGLTDELR